MFALLYRSCFNFKAFGLLLIYHCKSENFISTMNHDLLFLDDYFWGSWPVLPDNITLAKTILLYLLVVVFSATSCVCEMPDYD